MSKWRTFALPLALALPVVLLAGQWVQARFDAAEGVIWRIPVTGYDPHDMLRGHYVMLSHKWPGIADDAYPQGLCIKGRAPNIDSVAELRYSDDNGEPLTDACDAFVLSKGAYGMPDPLRVTRLYTDRENAQRIEKQLANGREGILVARIRPDGVIVPIRYEPKKWSPPAPVPPS
jgi:GDYXXLXY protein